MSKTRRVIQSVEKPVWIETASNHATLSAKEVMAWLGINSYSGLNGLLSETDFPPPRIGGGKYKKIRRWRVGDIRAWLKNSDDLRKELNTPLGDPDRVHKEGADKFFGFKH